MPLVRPFRQHRTVAAGLLLLVALVLCGGCATTQPAQAAADFDRPVPPDVPRNEVRLTVDLEPAQDCEERFDLVFIDPPYDLGLAAPACEALEALGLLKPDARIYVESRRHDAAPAVPESWERLREKDGGDVRAQLYRKE